MRVPRYVLRGTWVSQIYRINIYPESRTAIAPFSGEHPEFLTGLAEVAALQEPALATFDGRGSEHRYIWKSPGQQFVGSGWAVPAFEDNQIAGRRKTEGGSLLELASEECESVAAAQRSEHCVVGVRRLNDGAAPVTRADERRHPCQRSQRILSGAIIGTEYQSIGIHDYGQRAVLDGWHVSHRAYGDQPSVACQAHPIGVDNPLHDFDHSLDTGPERLEPVPPARRARPLMRLASAAIAVPANPRSTLAADPQFSTADASKHRRIPAAVSEDEHALLAINRGGNGGFSSIGQNARAGRILAPINELDQ